MINNNWFTWLDVNKEVTRQFPPKFELLLLQRRFFVWGTPLIISVTSCSFCRLALWTENVHTVCFQHCKSGILYNNSQLWVVHNSINMSINGSVQVYTIRFQPGQELKSSLEEFVKTHNLKAAFIMTCVGSVRRATLRFATPPSGSSTSVSERVSLCLFARWEFIVRFFSPSIGVSRVGEGGWNAFTFSYNNIKEIV